ncbi:MAG: succinate dehydrogenase [Gammaproteobacteria bacterium]|nr:succinate dehydrogenase [Gammaproteobacteria bacterium]MDH5592676.1 succinate dehydrogenase [Gammaproteobacteria bacterium]
MAQPLLQLQKRTMALAGLVMMIYLIFHMITNLSFFTESIFNRFYDWYSHGFVRWPLLVVVIVALFIHVKAAVRIRKVNARARTVDYKKQDKFKIPASLVTVSIVFLLIFIVVHIFQILLFDDNNLYEEVVTLFQSHWMVLFYLAGLFVLTMHLQHSLANVLQTLGKSTATYSTLVWTGTLLLTTGFASVPVYIYVVMS